MATRGWRSIIQGQDLVWLLLFGGMAAASPTHNGPEIAILAALFVVQVAEPKLAFFHDLRGNLVSIFLKLMLGYLLIGFTGGITSSFYLILLLPIVSAATTQGLWGTAVAVLASGSYLSFLLYLASTEYISPEGYRELGLRVVFFVVVAYLTHALAERMRQEARGHQRAAEQLAVANDNLQKAEAAVRRSDRLAALGQLTAGLAHELRNPLGTMRASSEMLRKHIGAEDELGQELAGYIATEVDRTNSLITRFLDFARPLRVKRETADLGRTIDEAIAQVQRHQPPYPVSIYKNYSPDLRPFPFDAELMERVIYNLVLNAAQASPAGGTVTVKTRTAENGVEIAVIDRGSGIDAQHRENIFNPFFTTKSDGVGLGLAIVSKIVDEHGGVMSVDSEVGKGSVFRIFLPFAGGNGEGQ